jgi:hypothetical protein
MLTKIEHVYSLHLKSSNLSAVDGEASLDEAIPVRVSASWKSTALTGLLVFVMVGFFVIVIFNWRKTWDLVVGWGINPWVYALLWCLSVPFYWWSLFMMKDGILVADRWALLNGFVINRTSWILPYAYAAIVGNGLPSWIRPALAVYLLGMGFYFWLRVRDPAYIARVTGTRLGKRLERLRSPVK